VNHNSRAIRRRANWAAWVRVERSAPNYYLHDGLGSTMALVDSIGTIQNRYASDPWGKTIASGTTGSVPNPFRYAGAMLDSSTGLYMMGERYYDPSIGRFTQPGSLGAWLHVYRR